MSEYGIKIKNIEAASIYEYQNGFRDKLHSRDAMLVNSLFLDFLLENGLNVYKGTSTRDVICLQFSYKTKGYAEMKKLVEYQLDKTTDERISSILNERKKIIEQNKEFCIEISKNDLRVKYYTEGVEITYKTFTKNDKREIESKRETIKYRMLYRTPGKAKKGTCMFIREELYDVARNFLYMGIQLPKKNPPIVEIGAYSSLITSSIVGKIQIKPEEILVIPDVDSFMTTKVISVETDENKNCIAVERDNYKLKNTMFDGQALIESSICPEWSDGYLLLRHHMFKAAAFKTHIQNFMKERFGVNYENATVKDIWGRDVKVSNIKLITTENALKWMKFDITFDYWSGWVRKNDCMFGIVKTAHESKLGQVQRMSYQMVNALDLDTMSKVVECSMKYIEDLKNNDEVFLSYLKKNINFSNDFDVLIALCEHNSDFVKSSYFKERRKAIIQTYTLNFKSGRIIQDADNLVIVGSPYAMLLHSVGEDPFSDPTFNKEEGAIQCWTNRFNDGEYLASFRSPFNSKNNMGHLHNSHHEYFDKYFNFGKQIIAVNMNGTDFQDRNNGLT